ncbi:hypothetical protein Tco_1342640 [Tanacetum coccineum]
MPNAPKWADPTTLRTPVGAAEKPHAPLMGGADGGVAAVMVLDLELAPTYMINYDLELLEIITFESSLQYHHESCYLVNLATSGPTCSYFSFVLKDIE